MYGCEWDDQTGAINGIYQDGYDGEDLVTMDYKELRYIASRPQGVPSAQKWNNEKGNLEALMMVQTAQLIQFHKHKDETR
ncbi:MHC class I antigen [Labeo rohita]|uniref:MHC class I antigen n=1 Tax=Labeo rohita TaxID=84645 RepID=A0A498P3G5_LABRO|nr:MHC class I antigen [Labeo rohita]